MTNLNIPNRIVEYMREWLRGTDKYTLEMWREFDGVVLDSVSDITFDNINCGFIRKMDREIINNNDQGVWATWCPSKQDGVDELIHHLEKLKHALINDDKVEVSEYSADIANIAMKIDMMYGADDSLSLPPPSLTVD